MVSMERCLVGCKVIKKNYTNPNPEMVSMERCLVGCKVISAAAATTTTTTTTTTKTASASRKVGGSMTKTDGRLLYLLAEVT